MDAWITYLVEERMRERRAEAERVRPSRRHRLGVRRWRRDRS
jgi:hypothetical protein